MTPRPKIALLGLTLELYEGMSPGLREGRERWVRESVLPWLAEVADVEFGGAVYRRADVDREVARLEAQGADALLVMLLTYSPSQIALPALTRTRLPIIVWNTQELFAVGPGFGGADLVNNHGVHGTQDLCNVLLRSGVNFSYVTSHMADADARARLLDHFAAAAAVARLHRARLGLLGYPFPGMGDFALDTTHLAATLGCEWTALSVGEFVDRAAAAPAERVDALLAEYRASYDIAPGIEPADLEATARAELALRGMVGDRDLQAITYQFAAFGEDERSPTIPFVAASRLMAEGVGFGGEGDLIACAGMLLVNWLMPPATFTEIFTIDFAGNGVLMSHMGELNVAMARRDRRVSLRVRPRPIARTRFRQTALVASLQPGPATLAALTLGPGGRWRVIAASVTIADFGPLDSLEVPHFTVSTAGDVRDFLTAYARAGGPHHLALCFGDARNRLRLACALLGADYCEV